MVATYDHDAGAGFDASLRELLAQGEQTRRALPQQLRHRIGFADPSLFDDELIARTRGLLVHLTSQIAGGRPPGSGTADHLEARDAVLRAVFDSPAMLAHCHALALEYRLTRRLGDQAGIDPVLPSILQEMIASPNEATSHLATAVLAAQTRFLSNMERMQLPLRQLPGELLHDVFAIGRRWLGEPIIADAVEQAVRTSYDEGATRTALLGRLVNSADYPQGRGWQLQEAGVPLFLAGLALAGGFSLHEAALLTTESQIARLALIMRTLRCNPSGINRNLYILHDEVALPLIAGMNPDAASTLLARSTQGQSEQDAA